MPDGNAQQNLMNTNPPGEYWRSLGPNFERKTDPPLKGQPSRRLLTPPYSLIAGTQDTENQTLTGIVEVSSYIFTKPDPNYTYYALSFHWEQRVDGYGYTKNVSAGYYGNTMELSVVAQGQNAFIPDFAPRGTIGDSSNSFTIGLGLSAGVGAEGVSGSASLDFSWTKTYSAPDTTISAQGSTTDVKWQIHLPGDEFCINGTDEPKPSAQSYSCDPQVLVRVPKGHPLNVSIGAVHEWHYMWPSQTINDRKVWQETFTYANGYFFIRHKQSGKVLDITNNDSSQGAGIGIYGQKNVDRNESNGIPANQLWYQTGDGQIVSALNDFCMDIVHANRADNAPVCMWPINQGANQKWSVGNDGRITSALDNGVLVVNNDGSLGVCRNAHPDAGQSEWELVPMQST